MLLSKAGTVVLVRLLWSEALFSEAGIVRLSEVKRVSVLCGIA